MHLPLRSNIRMDLLLIPVTKVLDPVLNHAKENVGSDCPGDTKLNYIRNTATYFQSSLSSKKLFCTNTYRNLSTATVNYVKLSLFTASLYYCTYRIHTQLCKLMIDLAFCHRRCCFHIRFVPHPKLVRSYQPCKSTKKPHTFYLLVILHQTCTPQQTI